MFLNRIIKYFEYIPKQNYEFSIDMSANNLPEEPEEQKNVFQSLPVNLEYIKTKYNMYSIMEIPNKINDVAMTSVGDYAFVSSTSGGDGASIIPTYLNTLDMSNCLSITSIGDASFNKSSMIKSLTLPPKLQTIAR